MTFLNDPAWQALLTDLIFPLALSVCLTVGAVIWTKIRARLPANVTAYIQTQLVPMAVAKAEQLATRGTDPISPDARKTVAITAINTILKDHGLTNVVPAELIDTAVEAAVYQLKTTGMVSSGNATIPLEIQAQLAQADPTMLRITPSMTIPATVGGVPAGAIAG